MTPSGTCARLLVRPLVLAVGPALAPAVFMSTTAPAQAEVQPCTVSYSTPVHALAPKPADQDHSWNPFGFPVTDTRVVNGTGTMNGLYVFDDEATQAKITGANPAPGRYQPVTPATALEGHPASSSTGRWSVWILNRSTSTGIWSSSPRTGPATTA